MKDGLKHLVGKRISGVVTARSQRSPREQVFLVFTDGSRFELYGDNFTCCSGLDDAEGIERYVKSGGGEVAQVHGKTPETLADLMRRDLAAWFETKALIARAKRS